MSRNLSWTACVIVMGIGALTLLAQVQAPPAANAKPFVPAATVDSLMNGQQDYFKAIQDLLEKGGKNTKQIRISAELLAELANVNHYHNDKKDYRDWAKELQDTSLALAREADKRKSASLDEMKKLLVRIDDVCTACHNVYREKAGDEEGGEH